LNFRFFFLLDVFLEAASVGCGGFAGKGTPKLGTAGAAGARGTVDVGFSKLDEKVRLCPLFL
jgi:hypothetical protein